MTARRALDTWLVLLAALVFVSAGRAAVPEPPEIPAKAHVLVDFHSGRVLSSFRPDARVHPASITKIMTVFAVFSELAAGRVRPSDPVRISRHAREMGGSRMFVEAGSTVTLGDLIKGIVVQSGNDASVAAAEHVSGSEAAFVGLMNGIAAELGMSRTHFANVHGLTHDDHYTTATDVATLSRELIARFPEYYAWHRIKSFVHNGIPQTNRNKLLWSDPSVDGIKTGHTSAAGYCLAASALRGGMRLISVVMGAEDAAARTAQSRALMEYGFRYFETRQLYAPGAEVTQTRIWKGEATEVRLGLAESVYLTYPRGAYDSLRAEVSLSPRIIAPVRVGEPQGQFQIKLDDEVLLERPLVVLADVPEGGFWRKLGDRVRLMLE